MKHRKEKLSDMFIRGSRLLLAAVLFAGATLPCKAVMAQEENLDQVFFSVGDPAFQIGQQVYHDYLVATGTDPGDITAADPNTEYARYLPLDEERPHRFLGYYIKNGMGECALGGCEFLVFENTGGGTWRLVMDGLAHQIWLNREDHEVPRDIYLKSLDFSTKPDKAEPIGVWSWDGDEYKFNRSFIP